MTKILPLLLCALIPLHADAFSFGSDPGDRVLFVNILYENEEEKEAARLSKPEEIKDALLYGGQIWVNNAVVEELIRNDKTKAGKKLVGGVFCADDNESMNCHYVRPYILSAIGRYGWSLKFMTPGIVFTKPYK